MTFFYTYVLFSQKDLRLYIGFTTDLELIGNRLQSAENAYESALNKLSVGKGNLVGRIEQLKTLGAAASKAINDDLLGEQKNDASEG